MEAQKNIRLLDLNEIKAFFSEIGEKPFRAKQVYEWLWKNSAMSFDDMSNLSLDTRNKLKENFTLPSVKIKTSQISSDKTIKNAFELVDGNIVEGVLIPSKTRMTACISSQVGCSLDCKFCATSRLKRMRNLNPDEIYDQVVAIDKQSKLNLAGKKVFISGGTRGLGLAIAKSLLGASADVSFCGRNNGEVVLRRRRAIGPFQ